MQKILIIGATSAIAEATARIYARRGAKLHLIARNQERLEVIAADLSARGASVTHEQLDVNELARHEAVVAHALNILGGWDVVLLAHGTLPDQARCEADADVAIREFNTNATSTIALLTVIANRMQSARSGSLAVISSVAGDRGRSSNYLYGSAKAAVNAFMSGLDQRLAKYGVRVTTIKPGFVDSPMTKDFKKGPLWAKPEQVAKGIVKAIEKGRPVAYLPWFWAGIMLVIRTIPTSVFRRLSL
ncbi:SDR family oxidoreductase [Luteibacter aegosomatis]|uniref:SDR family oxidoreductase n=1 Tax=Luteibacter aegosomatis TaxID=2911537 RepID=UPI001FFA1976|nr:SDR family oxidoreductase [Luteibacter aegosomatis]UPG86536.1 SDR family oxidoreductase [Luteibacter aegosomatis]